MKQQCHISMIYLSWVVYVGGLVAAVWWSGWIAGFAWLVAAPLLQWLYIVQFPKLSASMGYGPITDEPAAAVPAAPVTVVLYTALGCPFCPLVEERLQSLRKTMNFPLEIVDVTLRPDLLASKGIRSVPVVEVEGKFLFGLASTRELAGAIGAAVAGRRVSLPG